MNVRWLTIKQLDQQLKEWQTVSQKYPRPRAGWVKTLRALKHFANAMECEFVYAIVPKRRSSLENIIKARVEQVASERLESVAHSMSLEAQSVSVKSLKKQKKDLAINLFEYLNKNLWKQ